MLTLTEKDGVATIAIQVSVQALKDDLSGKMERKEITPEIADRTLTSHVYTAALEAIRKCRDLCSENVQKRAEALRAEAAKIEAAGSGPMLKIPVKE